MKIKSDMADYSGFGLNWEMAVKYTVVFLIARPLFENHLMIKISKLKNLQKLLLPYFSKAIKILYIVFKN